MLDVHAPHEKMHGFKDFLLHLLTITIGLLIALSLEGLVEWQHHRHLVQEADDSLRHEIAQNVKTLASLRQTIQDEQKQLDDDLTALAFLRAHPASKSQSLGFKFDAKSFDDVAWRTAQTTGALAYMPYGDASKYADVYTDQEQLVQAEQKVLDELIRAAAFPAAQPADWKPSGTQIDELVDRIGILRMRLLVLDSLVNSLGDNYQRFQAEKP